MTVVNRCCRHAAVVLIVLAGLLVGCGRGEDPDVVSAERPVASGPAGTGGPPAAPGDARLKWTRCMRDAGVRLDDPAPDGSLRVPPANEQDQTFRQAYEKCRGELPGDAPAPGRPDPSVQAKHLEYARCMRQHGVASWPDPGTGTEDQSRLAADPEFPKAYAACASIIGVSPELPDPNEPGHG